MANLTTTADLKAAVLQHAGELTDGTSAYDALVVTYLNRIYGELVCGGSTFVPELSEPWPWARASAPGTLALLPAYETGTATLTNASTSGTFSDAPAVSLGSFAGRFIQMFSRADVYRISTHTAGSTSFVLDQAYQEATVTASFTAAKLDYALTSGIARLVEPFRVFQTQTGEGNQEGKIGSMSSDELHRNFPLHRLQGGVPTYFAVISESSSGIMTVRFNKTPLSAVRVEYEYVPYPTDLTSSPDTTPIVPREHRSTLVYGATYWLMVDKNDSRADAYFRLTQQKIQGMLLNRRREYDDTSDAFGKLVPRADAYRGTNLTSTSGMSYY